MDTTVEIDREEYEDLLKSARMLSALECMGVDNWCGYSDAMHYYRTGEEP